MIKPEKVREIRARYKRLDEIQTSEWKSHWIDLADYILPRHGRFKDRRKVEPGRGDKTRHSKIINGSASRALSIAVSGLKGGLVPHSLPWFKLGLWDEDMAKWGPAKEWLHTCQGIMYSTFSRSNFYSAMSTPFTEQIVFGTGPYALYEDSDTVIHLCPWTAGEYVLATDARGLVDTGFRRFDMTVRAAANKWGAENLSVTAQNRLKEDADAYIEIVHCVYPRKDYDPSKSKMATQMPWASLYFETNAEDDTHYINESGFSSQPVMFPRWEVIGEDAYGSNCPGMECLADIKMLQKLEKDKLLGIEHGIDPAMNIPSSFKGRLGWLPGSRNYVTPTEATAITRTVQVDFQLAPISQEIINVTQRIQQGFFNDLFLMILNDKNMTATEVARRHEEKLAILGPVLERQNSESLSPTIDRVWDILVRRNLLPPPPPELEGQDIKVEYVSLLAQAQRAIGTQSIERVVGFAGQMAQFKPGILDKLDEDKIIEEYADLAGVKPHLIRSQEEVEGIRQAQAQQAQMQQMMQQGMAAAQMAKDMGNAPVRDDNALGSIVNAVQGA